MPEEIAQGSCTKKMGGNEYAVKEKGFLFSGDGARYGEGLPNRSRTVTACNTVGAGALILSAYLGCLITESLNSGGIEFSAICADRQMVRLSDETGEHRTAHIVGGSYDYKG